MSLAVLLQWAALSDEDRQPYIDEAAVERQQYEAAQAKLDAQYAAELEQRRAAAAAAPLGRREVKVRTRLGRAPSLPPPSQLITHTPSTPSSIVLHPRRSGS